MRTAVFRYSHEAVISTAGKVLQGEVFIELESPCLAVISGGSGSGKSTLLRAIAGLVETINASRILGNSSFPKGELPAWRSLVTLMMQDAPVIQGSIEENLSFPFRFKNRGRRKYDGRKARELLEMVGLGNLSLQADVLRLSGGERHRLGLVRGLLWDPPVLLADEALTGLEPELADRCFQLLREYAQRADRIVVAIFHERRFMQEADIRMEMRDGRLYRTHHH